jgi:uncharacterized membrane protein
MRPDSWSIGFVTRSTQGEVQNLTNDNVVKAFLPHHPIIPQTGRLRGEVLCLSVPAYFGNA